MIGKKFTKNGEIWTVYKKNQDGYSCICTNDKHGPFRFTFDELREILK